MATFQYRDGSGDIRKLIQVADLSPTEKVSLQEAPVEVDKDYRWLGLTTVDKLHKGKFGRSSATHSFTHHVLKFDTAYLTSQEEKNLHKVHPLIDRLVKIKDEYAKIDFRELKKMCSNYKSWIVIPQKMVKMLMA